jgi:hypothetical protein
MSLSSLNTLSANLAAARFGIFHFAIGYSMKKFLFAALVFALAGCASAPPTTVSRQDLWNKYGNQPIDSILLAWGPPQSETHLTDGSRLVSYSRSTVTDFGYYDQNTYSCKANFLAPPPSYKITNVGLDGADFECAELAEGRTGIATVPAPRPTFYFGGAFVN